VELQVDEEFAVNTTAGPPLPPDIAETLGQVARWLDAEESVEGTLEAVVAAAKENIPGVEHAGISLLDRGAIRTMAPSDEIVNRIDKLQYQLGEGPCVNAITDRRTYRTGDLAHEQRWPRFGRETATMGIQSMLSFRLFTAEDTLGALNLYAVGRDAFDPNSEQIGELFAVHAAIALAGSRQESHLLAALDTRDVIGMAKGILMERHGVVADRAFAIMVDASQKSQRKLHEVARWLVDETTAAAGK
jgi:transcriptional regulator with GAF, ATPase, and Fis domain